MKRTYYISNWVRRLWQKLFKKTDDSLEEWERLEFRKLRSINNRDQRQSGGAS